MSAMYEEPSYNDLLLTIKRLQQELMRAKGRYKALWNHRADRFKQLTVGFRGFWEYGWHYRECPAVEEESRVAGECDCGFSDLVRVIGNPSGPTARKDRDAWHRYREALKLVKSS